LDATQADLPRKLDPAKAKTTDIEKLHIDEATFEKMHATDRMAHDKLKEGIEGFSKALEELEQLLAHRVAELSAKEPKPVGAD
ncbi:MAG: transaldolase, partial [Acidobacteriaceae bacterium]